MKGVPSRPLPSGKVDRAFSRHNSRFSPPEFYLPMPLQELQALKLLEDLQCSAIP